MIIQLDIDNSNLLRLSNALDNPISGFKFDATSGVSLVNQKKLFIRKLIKDTLKDMVFNSERATAIANEPNDTAAEQAKRWVEPTITDSEL